MSRRLFILLPVALIALSVTVPAAAQRFSETVGRVRVGDVSVRTPLEVPFITWGGDVATFHANGGLKTARGSVFEGLGLDLMLVPGDDFPAQVKRYMEGESPFLRGTFRMLGQASEVIGSDARTKPVVVLQLTWSAGDHLVGREDVKTLADLKGRKIAIQRGGPHVGMLDDILKTAGLAWNDVSPVWMDELTGPGGPADAFRKDESIDACLVITPDMFGLSGGHEETGSGAEGTVRGARVVVSTASMSRSIADVYAVRKDFFDAHRDVVEKFVAGYLKGTEQLIALRNEFDSSGRSDDYMKILRMTQDIYGEEVIPTLEIDAHGLILDARFVGLPGNRAFFEAAGNLNGFDAKLDAALDLAVGQGYAGVRAGFYEHDLSYDRIVSIGGLTITDAGEGSRLNAEAIEDFLVDVTDDQTIFSFTINFEPNQKEFSAEVFGPEFQRTLEMASRFGNSVIAIRGHSDPTKILSEFVRSGLAQGILKRSGRSGNYKYFYKGREFDVEETDRVLDLVASGAFENAEWSPRQTMQAALNLSQARAEAVRGAIIAFANDRGVRLDIEQIQPVGVGASEPLIAKPRNMGDARQNMRVEFRLLKVPAEAIEDSEFDF